MSYRRYLNTATPTAIGTPADVEPIKLMAVVESLKRDGLARVAPLSERSAGHPAGAVAEERAPYAAGEKREDPTEIRVSLP